jgi:uncharacterized protein (DUF1501 family)
MSQHPDMPCPGPRLGRRGALLGLGAAFALGGARLAFAQAPGDGRLVVVLLRGGLDGLAAVQPYGDPAFAGLRGPLALPEPGRPGGTLDLGGRYGLHPALAAFHRFYRADQALVLHAVAGPYRSRSHFDAQDMLESGAAQRLDSGWLNRALVGIQGGPRGQAGLAIGLDVPLLMKGPAAVRNYAPAGPSGVNPDLMARIEGLLARDPAFGPAMRSGLQERRFVAATLQEEDGAATRGGSGFAALAGAAGRLMAAPGGPRIAALELGGFDSHVGQVLRLAPTLKALDDGLAALRQGLGEAAWSRTAVLVVTEFGRTARVNGSAGTDHGTAGVAFVLGGAVAGGRVRADWPGLGPGRLFEDRDLAPTLDHRGIAKGLLRDHLKLPPQAVEAAFPGSAGVAPLAGLVRA